MDSSNFTYTITFSDRERDALIFALGQGFRNVREGFAMFITPQEYINMSQRVMHAKSDAQTARTMSGTAAAHAVASRPAPPVDPPRDRNPAAFELHDHWQKNQKGIEAPFPDGYITVEAPICKIEDAPPKNDKTKARKKVTWEIPASNGGRGFADAYCWDVDLFPYLANRIKQTTIFYIVQSGQYKNLVGVRA